MPLLVIIVRRPETDAPFLLLALARCRIGERHDLLRHGANENPLVEVTPILHPRF
jgi:hypothetical protein